MKRLAPADFAFAFSGSQEKHSRARYGREGMHKVVRAERTLRNTDLHKIFRVGRELTFVRQDGTIETRRLRAAEAKNAIVLVEKVKAIVGVQPQMVLTDARLASELGWRKGKKDSGWSVSTVRRTRRICAAAGIDVKPLVSDGNGVVEPELRGCLWILDRRVVPALQLVQPPSQMNRGVAADDHTSLLRARENETPSDSPSGNGGARASPTPDAPAPAGLEESSDVRGPQRQRRRARPPEPGEVWSEVQLLRALLGRRWKVGQDWGLAAALAAVESLAVAEGADPLRVAVARRRLAFELMGEQLALRDAALSEATPRSRVDAAPGQADDASGGQFVDDVEEG